MHRAQKKYYEALHWLDSQNQNKIVPGLERIAELMNILKNPQKKLKLIIIGGTNAKGSTCFNLNHNLTRKGFKIGCFTSPHIHSVRERIRIGSELIKIEDFADLINSLKDIIEEYNIEATYFEILTAAAYQYFHIKKVDYAIMEVGLGGEWDAVNVGNAKIAILTTLGIDHVDYLGSDIEGIARTKAKIVRSNTNVITGWPKEYHKLIPKGDSLTYSTSKKDWIQYTLQFLNIDKDVKMIKIPGRYEKAENFVIDTAHNSQAIQYLISKEKKYEVIIIGAMKDKDIESMISHLPKTCEIFVCNLKTERAADSNELARICAKLGYKHRQFNSVKKAMEFTENKRTLVTGSFYTVSEARKYLQLNGHSEL
tara:strand:- start:45 stop:1148 length:1104 start_codon:yes stop_codon:yes gene_type:complete